MIQPRRSGRFSLGVQAHEYVLPHDRIPLAIILIIRRALLHAFAKLTKSDLQLAVAKEDEITNALHGILENDLRQKGTVAGFNQRLFEAVTRHGPVENYNFTKVKTAPDLCFKLRGDGEPRPIISAHDALFVECKPIDKEHAAGGDYCDEGVTRFVVGDYAWAMQDALMIAYVRHGRALEKNLVPAMEQRTQTLKTVSLPRAVAGAGAEAGAEALRVSCHKRGFPWPHEKGAAVDIFVYHAWHNCDG